MERPDSDASLFFDSLFFEGFRFNVIPDSIIDWTTTLAGSPPARIFPLPEIHDDI
jgi:hypothetical protein